MVVLASIPSMIYNFSFQEAPDTAERVKNQISIKHMQQIFNRDTIYGEFDAGEGIEVQMCTSTMHLPLA